MRDIQEAIGNLDGAVGENFTKDGKPAVAALEKALGREVTAQERDEAWAEHLRGSESPPPSLRGTRTETYALYAIHEQVYEDLLTWFRDPDSCDPAYWEQNARQMREAVDRPYASFDPMVEVPQPAWEKLMGEVREGEICGPELVQRIHVLVSEG